MSEIRQSNNTINPINIIGSITTCVHHDCQGRLVDSFSEKYLIRCLDPRHNNKQRQIENEEAASQSTFLNQPEQCSQQKKRIIDK